MLTTLHFIVCVLLALTSQPSAHKIYHPENPKVAPFRHHLNIDTDGKGFVNVTDMVYAVGMRLGESPTTEVILVFDTGSDFIWVQSANCTSCMDVNPPNKPQYNGSSELYYESCEITVDCPEGIPGANCSKNYCNYAVQYGDGSNSMGMIGSDSVFPYTDTDNNHIPFDIMFGIGTINICLPRPTVCFQGIAGFGAGLLSLPSQLDAQRWGFCLPNNASMDGAFLLGDIARIPGEYETAPLYDDGVVYFTNLTNVFVYGDGTLPSASNNSMIFIDTGTTNTFLEGDILESVIDKVKYTLTISYNAVPIIAPEGPERYKLCYDELYNMEITIQMSDILITIADSELLWYETYDDTFCLRLFPNEPKHNILGNIHIKGYMVAYNLSVPGAHIMEVSTQPLGGEDAGICLTPASP